MKKLIQILVKCSSVLWYQYIHCGRGVDSSHMTWTRVRLESQIWWLLTRLHNIIKDLQLDLDFNINDSWLHWDLSLMTWDLKVCCFKNVPQISIFLSFPESPHGNAIHSQYFDTSHRPGLTLFEASYNIQSSLRTNHEEVGGTILNAGASSMLTLAGQTCYQRFFFSCKKTTRWSIKSNCSVQNMQVENYRQKCNNFQLHSTFEVAQEQ